MATNMVYENGNQLPVAVTDPATPASGDPVRWGEKCGVALGAKGAGGNASTDTTVKFDGCFNLSVKGIDGGGNSAVAVGDIIYYVDADTPKLSKKNTGRRFGYAMATVGSGLTATIAVKLGY
jgi:predicted RecA/RadA family phage recombinase